MDSGQETDPDGGLRLKPPPFRIYAKVSGVEPGAGRGNFRDGPDGRGRNQTPSGSRDILDREITERKRADAALQESEDKFRQLVENINEIFWLENKDATEMLYVSPAYERIMGRSCQSLYDSPKNWVDAIHPEDRKRVMDAFIKGRLDGTYSEEFRVIRPDGSIRWIHDRGWPIRDERGEVHRIAGIAEDITERKRTEEELKDSEEKLLEAQKMEVVGNLAAGMAHEVRNPLNSIMALTDALFVEIGDNLDAQPYIKHIQAQVDRLSVLMRDLLSLGKPVDVSALERLDLYDICTAAMGLCLHPVKGDSTGCKCRLIKAPGVNNILVACDGERLKQAFLNILENAANHNPDGSEVRLIIEEPVDGMCTVKVLDLGAGIPEENIPRLFEPFFTTRRGGTGLGLSLVKNIVESIGGTVGVSNNDPPPGCCFEITLPLAKDE